MDIAPAMNDISEIIQSQQLQICMQPIWDLFHAQILGYEALVRGPKNSAVHHPEALFKYAHEQSYDIELEWECARLAVERAIQLGRSEKLFINLSPQALCSDLFYNTKTLCQWQLKHPLVIEITENTPFETSNENLQFLQTLRDNHIQLALDDFGSGHANLKTLLAILPDYLKLDGFFADHLNTNWHIPPVIEQLVNIAERLQITLIAEKIETQEQLEILANLNINYFQGYFIQKPQVLPTPLAHMQKIQLPPSDEPYTAASLVRQNQTVGPDVLSSQLLSLMRKNTQLDYCAVVNHQQQVEGLISREKLLEAHSGPFGHSLHKDTTVKDIMEKNPMIIESHRPLSDVGHKLSYATAHHLDGAFIITQHNRYLGLGYATDLIKRLSDYRLQLARSSSPLTQLPGNVSLHRKLRQLLAKKEPFYIAYFDLNHFKPFNDYYGYERGDQMIQIVARLLRQYFSTQANFIGHLGGDDFIVIFTAKYTGWEDSVRQLIAAFYVQSQNLYREEDRQRGGIISYNRQNESQFFPLTQIACGVAFYSLEKDYSIEMISEQASLAKKQAKLAESHFYYIELTEPLSA